MTSLAARDAATEALLADEFEALASIYGDEAQVFSVPELEVIVDLPESPSSVSSFAALAPVQLHIVLGPAYPHAGPPAVVEFLNAHSLARDVRVATTAAALAAWQPGEASLYAMVEAAREALLTARDDNCKGINGGSDCGSGVAEGANNVTRVGGRRHASSGPGDTSGGDYGYAENDKEVEDKEEEEEDDDDEEEEEEEEEEVEIVSGEAVTERRSTFQAHLARVGSRAQAARAVAALHGQSKLARATHIITAYRFLLEPTAPGRNHAGGSAAAPCQVRILIYIYGLRCWCYSRLFSSILGPAHSVPPLKAPSYHPC